MPFLKRALVHLSLLVGVASIVLEQDQWLISWLPQETATTENLSSDILLTNAIRDNLKEKSIPNSVEKAEASATAPSLPEEFLTFKELKSVKWKGPSLKLVSAFSDEQLKGRQIFDQLSTYSSLSRIFKQEVVGFERGTLRSGSYRDSSGFDQIYYKIYYPAGKIAHVLVREGDSVDLVIYTPSAGGYTSQSFQDGVWSMDQTLSEIEVQNQIQGHLRGSSPVLSAAIGAI